MSQGVLGSYDCYAGHQQVANPALRRQIQFSRGSGGAIQAKYIRADGSCEAISLDCILVQDRSVEQQMALLRGGAQLADVVMTSAFSALAAKRQEEIARGIGDQWDVSITWVRNADGHIATQSTLDRVESLELTLH